MDQLPPPLAFFFLVFSGWVNGQQQVVTDYLLEENSVLRAELREPDAFTLPTTNDGAWP